METAAELVRNFTQRIRNFGDFMDNFASDDAQTFRSASVSEHDMEQATSGLETRSDEDHSGAAGDRNDVFRGFYTGEHRNENSVNVPGGATAHTTSVFSGFHTGERHDENSVNTSGVAIADSNHIFSGFHTSERHDGNSADMPNSPGFELPSPPAHFRRNDIIPPQLRLSSEADAFLERFYAGEPHSPTSPLFVNAGPALTLQAHGFRTGGSPISNPGPASSMQAGGFHTGGHHPPTNPFFINTFSPPIMQEGGADNLFLRFHTGRDPYFNPGPASSMQAGAHFLNQLPDIGLEDIPNVTSCNICMETFGSTEDPESESPVRLPCCHVMGRKCISRWLETSNSCPMCRHVLFEQARVFRFQGEGDFPVGQEELNRSWDNLEPRLQQLVRSMTAQEQQHLLRMLQESNTPELETVQGEQLQVPGVSPEEVEAYQTEHREIGLQRAAIDRRLEDMELENVPLTSQRATEVRELEEDNEMLSARLDNFHLRYRDLINYTLFD